MAKRKKKPVKQAKKGNGGRPPRIPEDEQKAFVEKVESLPRGAVFDYLEKKEVSYSTYYNWKRKWGKNA